MIFKNENMENNGILISVITITYGHEKYILDTLEGVLMQDYNGPIEFIIANDNSPDNTDEIIKQYFENITITKNIEVRYKCHDINKGLIENFKWALMQARGKYIALCEGDDYWTDRFKLQKQVDFLENNREYGLVHTNFVINNTKTGIKQISNGYFLNGQTIEDYLVGKFHIATLTTCFRKDLLDKIDSSYLKQNFSMGDHPMWIEFMRFSKIKYLSDTTATYNIISRPLKTS